MKIICVFTFVLLVLQTAICQSYEDPCKTDTLNSTGYIYEGEIEKEIVSRKIAYDFHYTMKKIREPSTISMITNWKFHNYGYQKKPFFLDSDINIPIAIHLGKLHTLQLIPRFKFRIFQNDFDYPFGVGDVSEPVRTPSAMPGVVWYFTLPQWWTESGGDTLKFFKEKYFGIYVYHHSNGQDGEELDFDNAGEINTYNGNFAEEAILEFIFGGRKKSRSIQNDKCREYIKDNKAGEILRLNRMKRREFYWKLGYEWHPKIFTHRSFDNLDIYGRHRLNINLSYLIIPRLWELFGDGEKWYSIVPEKSYERWRHTLNINYVLDGNYKRGNYLDPEVVKFFNLKRRLNINYTIYYVIGRSNAAVFAQFGYQGTDDYNIYFNDSYTNIRVGIAFAFFDQPDRKFNETSK